MSETIPISATPSATQISLSDLQACWFLAGPTASGKSAVAEFLAAEGRMEIIGLDSMTLYRGMDIGTAKPTLEERTRVPHHLFDVLDPWEEYSVANYVQSAAQVVREILDRRRTPLFVGGSGLYLRSLLRGVFSGPPAHPEIRQRLARELESQGPAIFHDRLKKVDPEAAARISPNDARRMIRALEVLEVTGRPLSSLQQQRPQHESLRPRHVYWLSPEREWLHRRINERVISMWDAGWIEEVRRLVKEPRGLSSTARQALGYQELLLWLESGQTDDLKTVISRIQARTRQFAKRQMTWFRNLVECQEIPIRPEDSPGQIARQLWK